MAQDSSLLGTYDYIVCGGGTAGCAVAARLAEDPLIHVLVLEAGGSKESVPFSAIPAAVGEVVGSKDDWLITNEPNPALNGREIALGRGKFLGGSSGINGTLCIRGSKDDYDAWDIPGWSGDEVYRYMAKAESFKNKPWFQADEKAHGFSGPILTAPHDNAPISDLVMKSFVEHGLPFHSDMFTTGDVANGCGHAVRTIYKGIRTMGADYITGVKAAPNIHIMTSNMIDRLILEIREGSLTATGVEFALPKGNRYKAYARKEIVLSAGTYGTPGILLRSGIGARNEVEKHGIQSRLDLPGVGKNLMDHTILLIFYEVIEPGLTTDHLVWHTGALERSTKLYQESQAGFLSQFPFGAFAYARLDERLEDSPMWQEAKAQRKDGLDPLGLKPTQPHIEFWNTECVGPNWLVNDFPADGQQGFALVVEMFGAKSRGFVTLRSSDPSDNPIVDHKHLTDPLDMLVLSEGCSFANEIVTTASATKDIIKGSWPETLTHHKHTKRENWEPELRAQASTCYHPAGTCKMGRDGDPMAVLDPELRVRGISNLRVADASVMPLLMGGHPQMAVYAIGEKAADLIKTAA